MKTVINVVMFVALGVVCASCGVTVRDWHYWAILGIAMVISVNAFWEGLDSGAKMKNDK